MKIKRFSKFLKAPELEPNHQIVFVSYIEHSLRGCYPFVKIQSTYSTTPAEWTGLGEGKNWKPMWYLQPSSEWGISMTAMKYYAQNKSNVNQLRIKHFPSMCPWSNGHRRRNWTRRHELKSWTDCISHSTKTLGKGMNPIILPPAMGKIVVK